MGSVVHLYERTHELVIRLTTIIFDSTLHHSIQLFILPVLCISTSHIKTHIPTYRAALVFLVEDFGRKATEQLHREDASLGVSSRRLQALRLLIVRLPRYSS